ncbi:MAG: hypothetical protein WBB31_19240 [Saprospiraceae bacterium]
MNRKHIIISAILLLGSIWCFSQSGTLDDFWKDIERRKGLKKNDSDALTLKYESQILNAFGKRIILLQQDYIYEKKNKRYLRGNDDFYGREYGIGFADKEGIITSKHMAVPWKDDQSLLASKGYTPVRTNIQFRPIVDTLLSSKEEGKYFITTGETLIRYQLGQQQETGNELPQPATTGLLLLFYRDSVKDTVRGRIIEFKPQWIEGVAEIDTPWLNKHLIGGFFVNTDTIDTKLNFAITGILSGETIAKFKLIQLKDNISMKPSGKPADSNGIKGSSSTDDNPTPSDKKKKENNANEKKKDTKMETDKTQFKNSNFEET